MTHGPPQYPPRRSARATWRPFVGQILDVAGGAFEPEIREYRENTGDVGERTARESAPLGGFEGRSSAGLHASVPYPHGVPLMHRGNRVPAKYFSYRPRSPEDRIHWCSADNPVASVCSPEFNAVVVNIDATVLDRDEEFLHVLAHEVYEVSQLKEFLQAREAGLSAVEVYNLDRTFADIEKPALGSLGLCRFSSQAMEGEPNDYTKRVASCRCESCSD